MPNPICGKIDANIGRSPYDRKKMAIVQAGKSARTNYKLIENYNNFASLVQCNLETGRTHQIRVHMSSMGCNLIGDQLYVKSKKNIIKSICEQDKSFINNFPRQALHATTLGFIHPRSKSLVSFTSSFPDDFESLKNILSKI